VSRFKSVKKICRKWQRRYRRAGFGRVRIQNEEPAGPSTDGLDLSSGPTAVVTAERAVTCGFARAAGTRVKSARVWATLALEIILKREPEKAAKLFRTAHWTFVVTCADHPADARLLAMH
jgi:hypothetical protein